LQSEWLVGWLANELLGMAVDSWLEMLLEVELESELVS
jgi:hypothetical protein